MVGFSARPKQWHIPMMISSIEDSREGRHVAAKKRSKPNRHTRTRADHATELAEDYVEAVAEIIDEKGACRAVDLARQFQVSHVTVNRTVGRLQRDGYVKTEPYGPIELTPAGRRLAAAAARRHEIVLEFLIALGVSEPTAQVDSEGIEHHVSDETLKAMRAFVKRERGGGES